MQRDIDRGGRLAYDAHADHIEAELVHQDKRQFRKEIGDDPELWLP